MSQDKVALSLRGVTKRYGKGRNVLGGISCDLPYGQLVGLVGPNGSGKSTFLHIMAGVLIPTSGSVTRHTKDLKDLVWVSQHHAIDWYLSVLDNTRLGARLGGYVAQEARDIAIKCLRVMGLEDKLSISPDALSMGQQRRLQVARALAQNAKILLFDEPTTGLDVLASQKLMKELASIAANGALVVVSSHDFDMLENVADQYMFLSDGNFELQKKSAVKNLNQKFLDSIKAR